MIERYPANINNKETNKNTISVGSSKKRKRNAELKINKIAGRMIWLVDIMSKWFNMYERTPPINERTPTNKAPLLCFPILKKTEIIPKKISMLPYILL